MAAWWVQQHQAWRTEPLLPPLLPAVWVPLAAVLLFAMGGGHATSPPLATCEGGKVLVIGSNGSTGRKVVALLKHLGRHEPVAMVRKEEQLSFFEGMGVKAVVGDLESPLEHVFEGISAVIFAAGSGKEGRQVMVDHLGAIRAVATAQAKGVKRFVMLGAINCDERGTFRTVKQADEASFESPLARFHRSKARADNFLMESAKVGAALDWTIVSPARLTDDEASLRVLASLNHHEWDLKDELSVEERAAGVRTFPAAGGGEEERLVTSRANLAHALVGVLDVASTFGKRFTVIDGVLPIEGALAKV